jgi:uncharacterized membrane protein
MCALFIRSGKAAPAGARQVANCPHHWAEQWAEAGWAGERAGFLRSPERATIVPLSPILLRHLQREAPMTVTGPDQAQPPQPQPPQPPMMSGRQLALIVYILYFVAYITGITALIGVIIAHVQAGSADPITDSHYRFQIRTFWVGVLYLVIGTLLLVVLVGIAIYFWWFIWSLVRNVKGVLALNENRPIANPTSWLFG